MLLEYEKEEIIKQIKNKVSKKETPKSEFRRQFCEILEDPDFQFN